MIRQLTTILADDHAIVREGLKLLITAMDDVSVIAEAADGQSLLKLAQETKADLLVLDLGMPGVSGVPFIAEIRDVAPRLKIVVLTANTEPRTVRAALEAGANAYLTKDGDPEELGTAIETLRLGKTYVARTVRFAIADPADRNKPPVAPEVVSPVPLTPRERQTLLLVAQGLTARETAERLGISPATARKHRENLMRKLDLHTTAELTAYAVRLGLPAG